MGLAAYKLSELKGKLASVDGEFERWLAVSEPGEPLEKHNTQIRRVTAQLSTLVELLRAEFGGAAAGGPGADDLGRGALGARDPGARHPAAPGLAASDPAAADPGVPGPGVPGPGVPDPWARDPAQADAELLASYRDKEAAILELHRIWEYFRSKLAQRWVDWLAPYLKVADEFAWCCYGYAQRTVKLDHRDPVSLREPPLVFLNGGSSPFTMSRDFSYQAEAVPGEHLTRLDFKRVLQALPIPVIGVPWYQVHHLPEALVIAHEVGHNVEDDFGLGDLIDAALAGAGLPAARLPAWQSWRGEIFADAYGVLAGGPAFVGALMDFLAGDPTFIAADRQPREGQWDIYPTDAMRIRLALQLLRDCSFANEADDLGARWRAAYGAHAMPEFEVDLGKVSAALLAGPYPFEGDSLAGFAWKPTQHRAALDDADEVLNGYPLQSDDVRSLIVVSRLAFEKDPADYVAKDVQRKIVERAMATMAVGPRTSEAEQLGEAERATADQQAGTALFERIRIPGA